MSFFRKSETSLLCLERDCNARYIGHSEQGLKKPLLYLQERFPDQNVVSLAMNSEAVNRRDASLYEVYHSLYLSRTRAQALCVARFVG